MSDYLTEQEQIDQLKKWAKEYGLTILAGIVLAIIFVSGWRYWQNYRNRILTHASAVYDEMLTLRAQNNLSATNVQAKKLLHHYAHTPYADMAAMMLARDAVLNKNYPEAKKQLNWVLDHSNNSSIKEIARVRIARILIAEKTPQAALNLLNKINDKNFSALINEVKGDAYLALNNNEAAKTAYKMALEELPNAEVVRPILQMKYDNLT